MSDKTIRKGDLVRLIGTDGYMPPIGAIGTVVSNFDCDDDADVLFHGHPCPNPPGTYWVAARWMLRKIDPPATGEYDGVSVRKPISKPIKHKEPA